MNLICSADVKPTFLPALSDYRFLCVFVQTWYLQDWTGRAVISFLISHKNMWFSQNVRHLLWHCRWGRGQVWNCLSSGDFKPFWKHLVKCLVRKTLKRVTDSKRTESNVCRCVCFFFFFMFEGWNKLLKSKFIKSQLKWSDFYVFIIRADYTLLSEKVKTLLYWLLISNRILFYCFKKLVTVM